VHYAYDTVALAKVGGSALVKAGNKKLVLPDRRLRLRPLARRRRLHRGQGQRRHRRRRRAPPAERLRLLVLPAAGAGSKAEILALANAGGDFINAMKAAKEFGIGKTMKVAGLLVFINDVHSLGLANTEGLQLADSWYWNQDDASRKFAKRFFDKYKRMPSSLQAADYSATHELPEGRADRSAPPIPTRS
jgi:branched-chain amino acid transport system substrate-binding protein